MTCSDFIRRLIEIEQSGIEAYVLCGMQLIFSMSKQLVALDGDSLIFLTTPNAFDHTVYVWRKGISVFMH